MAAQMLLIRADAGITIGTGHVMRCLALAQACQEAGGDVVFAMAESTPAIDQRLQKERIEVVEFDVRRGSDEDCQLLVELAQERAASWTILDGYCFGSGFQCRVKNTGLKILSLDDNGDASPYCADIVLNQNVHASEDLYRLCGSHTRLLLGAAYSMLRREFRQLQGWKREIETTARKILITMGGSDAHNLSSLAIRAVELIDKDKHQDIETVLLAGGSNPHVHSIAQAISDSGVLVRIETGSVDVAEWMQWADIAIAAAGSTCWELCYAGVPSIVIDAEEHQRPMALELDRRIVAVHASLDGLTPEKLVAKVEWLLQSTEMRTRMSRNGQALVDGLGVNRVLQAMTASECAIGSGAA